MNDLPPDTWHGFKYLDRPRWKFVYTNIPCNICQSLKQKILVAAIHKYDGELITVADGVRNSVGFDWHPITKDVFSDNGRDWLGDDSPPCELNKIDVEGSFDGFPYKHAKIL